MKVIYLSRIGRTVQVPDHVWQLIAVYKVFWPPDKVIQLGKTKKIQLKDLELQAPPEQSKIDF